MWIYEIERDRETKNRINCFILNTDHVSEFFVRGKTLYAVTGDGDLNDEHHGVRRVMDFPEQDIAITVLQSLARKLGTYRGDIFAFDGDTEIRMGVISHDGARG